MSYASEQAILNEQWNAATMAFQVECLRASPHVLMRPGICPDGNQWCALYGDNLQDGVAGFGDTPEAACADFDKNWREQRLMARQSSEAQPIGAAGEAEAALQQRISSNPPPPHPIGDGNE